MPRNRLVRFEQMAALVKDRIENPSEAGVERYVGLKHLDSDSLKIRRWGEPSDVEAAKLLFQPGDIIFGKRRVYQRKLAVADFHGICSAHAMVLRARADVVLPEFLPFFMQSDGFMNRALEISVGSLSPTINWRTLAEQEFALPPLDEQRRVAELLLAIQVDKESLQCVVQKAFRVRLRLCLDIGREATVGNGAECCSVESQFECLDSRRVPLNETQRNENCGNIPYYGATGQVGTVGEHIFDEPLILVAEDGGPFNEFDEKPVAYAIEGKSWVNNHAHVLRPRNQYIETWLLMNLMHRDFRRFMTGTTRGKLNKGQLMRVPLWIPKAGIIRSQEQSFKSLSQMLKKLKCRVIHLQNLQSKITRYLLGI